ncbi:MAG TPA: ABC transporter permease, partial [Blastocatellia bacterium]|nr:ABC transporter permease [Blastocatellia bacterium]
NPSWPRSVASPEPNMPEWKREIIGRLAVLKLEPTREAEIVEELSQHLDDRYSESVANGATPEEAFRAALAELGASEILQSELRRAELPAPREPIPLGTEHRTNMIAGLWQDLRYGARMLRKNPAFTLVVVMTLSLGIGANTAIFSVVNTVLLQPLPIKDGARIVELRIQSQQNTLSDFSYPDFTVLRDRAADSIDLFATYGADGVILGATSTKTNVTDDDDVERVGVTLVSANYFATLGATTVLGRTLADSDDQTPGAHPVVVLSHGFWRRRFGSDPEIVGKALILNSQAFTVVGVTGPDFTGTEKRVPWMWAPLKMAPDLLKSKSFVGRDSSWLRVMGKLKLVASRRRTEEKLAFIFSQTSQDRPETMRNSRVKLFSPSLLPPRDREILEKVSVVALGAVALVLLIACANVTNLTLARMATRQREIAVRLALGASRLRMIRQLFAESLLLAGLGGLSGLLITRWAAAALEVPLAEMLPQGVLLDTRVIAYTSALSLGAAIVFGLTPAWQATRFNFVQSLKQESGLFGRRLARSRFRGALVVAQVTVSLVLLVGAGLFVRALQRAMNLQPGFDIENNWVIELDLRRRGYDQTRAAQFNRDFQARIEAMSSVKAAVWVGDAPLGDTRSFTDIGIAGRKPSPGEPRPESQYNTVSPNYFSALNVPLLRGRAFSEEDVNTGSPLVVITESMARAYWPNEDPLGKRLWVPAEGSAEIVGVAKDSLLHAGYAPYFYQPVRPGNQLGLRLLVKTNADSPAIGAALKEAALALDPRLKLSVKKHDADIKDKFRPIQLGGALSSLFGVLALALAAMGLYGVMAHAMEQRTHEIGVRMALGARPADVLRLALRQGMALAAIGALIGLVGSLAATRVLKAALFGISPTDPVTFAGITSLLLAVACLACWVPARRATKVDPMAALRCE